MHAELLALLCFLGPAAQLSRELTFAPLSTLPVGCLLLLLVRLLRLFGPANF